MNLLVYACLCVLFIFAGAGLAGFLSTQGRKQVLQDILSLSGAFLFGILILELFPAIFKSHNHIVGLFVLIGFFLQIGIDMLTGGVEHGHLHFQDQHKQNKGLLISLFAGLAVHAVFDGLPFAGFDSLKDAHMHSLYTGILIHKIAEGFTLYMVMHLLGMSMWKSLTMISLFAILTPLGIFLIQGYPSVLNHLTYILAFAGGSLLHVSITILFESENQHHHGIAWRKLIWIALGIGAALAVTIL